MTAPSASLIRLVKRGLLAGGSIFALLAVAVWLLPLEVAQAWAVERAGADEFEQFEAFAASAAAVWFVRWASTAATLLLMLTWLRQRSMVPFLAKVLVEFWQAAGMNSAGPIRRTGTRLFVIAWLLLAGYHAGCAVQRRLWDWPVFRLHSGHAVLPNISDTNREVIRYLEAATPPGSRILILSDQKLFFLSYYLLPRRLYHPVHPDSEFVIPQPYNQRQLAAYRLQDLTPERVRRLRADFILDYFEGAPYTDGLDLEQDANWVNFQRRRRGPDWRPKYLVSLRRYAAEGP